MVLIKDQYSGIENFPVLDANDDLKRVSRARNVQCDEKSLRLSEDDAHTEAQYKVILYHLLAMEERLNPQKDNDKGGVREDKIRWKALKRKAGEISKKNDGGNGADGDNERQDRRIQIINRKHECGPSCQTPVAQNVHKPNHRSFLVNKTGNAAKIENMKGPRDIKTTKGFMPKASVKDAQMDFVQISASEFRKAQMALKNIKENNLEKDDQGRSDSDVEILEEAACVKRGITNPFVSKKFCFSMEDGTGRSNEQDEFRKRVLDVLKKPYDLEEYKRHVEAIQAGNYFVHHPDVERKLKKHRYNKGKRLNILRGFFFWLQNITQEGAFKPWKDGPCLAVEPSSQ